MLGDGYEAEVELHQTLYTAGEDDGIKASASVNRIDGDDPDKGLRKKQFA